MPIQRWWVTVRDSLWFIPAIWVVVSAILAFALITFDRITPEFAASLPLVFGGGAEGARGLLSSIAGSMITVAGVTFSITIVALQLASSQLSPRVLRSFMRDRANQVVLGSFIGAFTYAILVLRSIRADLEQLPGFVPSVAVSVGILYALLALGMLVFFIHHIANRIQVGTIVGNIADETVAQVDRDWPETDENGGARGVPAERPARVDGRGSGYLQLVDMGRLTEMATERDLVLRLEVRPGEWVQEATPLFSVWPATAVDSRLADELNDSVSLGAQRSIEQDAAFGIRQLVDVAVKAISPGINDPTSAIDCINRLGQILVAVGRRHHPRWSHRGDDGRLRMVVPYVAWEDLVGLAVDQLRQYSVGSPDISLALADTLRTVAIGVPSRRHAPLERQARLIAASAAAIEVEEDRRRVLAGIERAIAAMAATSTEEGSTAR